MQKVTAKLGQTVHAIANEPAQRRESQTDAFRQISEIDETRNADMVAAQLTALASSINVSPRVSAQTALVDGIGGSPLVTKQRRLVQALGQRSHSRLERPQSMLHEEAGRMRFSVDSPVSSYLRQTQRVVQRVRGNNGLQDVKEAIYEGTGKAVPIATDIYGAEVDDAHDGDFTVDTKTKIEKSALSLGYSDERAQRLANKRPYTASEITADGNTRRFNADSAESYVIESFEEYGFPGTGLHKLYFSNEYKPDGEALFLQNFRNPAMAEFHANDVFREQRAWIESEYNSKPEITKLVRNNVISSSGGTWLQSLGSPFAQGALDQTQLGLFLTTTVNGKSSLRIASDLGKTIVSGSISGSSDNWKVTLILGRNRSQEDVSRTTSATSSENTVNVATPQSGAAEHSREGAGQPPAMQSDAQKAQQLQRSVLERSERLRNSGKSIKSNLAPFFAFAVDGMTRLLPDLETTPTLMRVFLQYYENAIQVLASSEKG